ncbi:hypothetical protein R3P38DRAFT_3539567 [Favolaschia claudopus]|uniref:Uncharacterized protein n=1 Tax=Favolaschia claudopus TaxID=2862362 RepID=A0AAW0B9Z6_9AGAR
MGYVTAPEAVHLFSPSSSPERGCRLRPLSLPIHPSATMELENDFQEAFSDLSDVLSASGTTLNVSGGIGGQGGGSGQEGGAGGNGEGPIFNFAHAEGWIVHVNNRGALKNSRTLGFDSGPRAVSLCDINLQREVYLDIPRLCPQRRRGNAVRRYHTAEVENRKEMTVVFYEGQNAEEELKRDLARAVQFRYAQIFLQSSHTIS